jgi:hypothetical protein
MSPAEKAAREEMLDAKMRERAGKAYDKAMPNPDTTFGDLAYQFGKKPKITGQNGMPDLSGPEATKRKPRITGQDGVPDLSSPELFKKKSKSAEMKTGGSVSSASKRADGIAAKGKTKGTMIKMNYGGKC